VSELSLEVADIRAVLINPRRACAARVTVLGLCVCVSVCLCVCVSVSTYSRPTGTKPAHQRYHGSSATRARKIMWRFWLNGGVREIWC